MRYHVELLVTSSAVFDTSIWRCIITEIWWYESRYSWPCIDILAWVQQWTALNLNTRTPFKMFNKYQCLIWPQRNTTGLPDIKRHNPQTQLPTCAIRKYLLSVIFIFFNLATMCTRTLSTVDKRACFLKTPASLQFSNLHFNILSEKSSSVHLWERGRERVL